jgi:hypothetical protein
MSATAIANDFEQPFFNETHQRALNLVARV